MGQPCRIGRIMEQMGRNYKKMPCFLWRPVSATKKGETAQLPLPPDYHGRLVTR